MIRRFTVFVKGYRGHHKYPFGSYVSEKKKTFQLGLKCLSGFEDYNPLKREILHHLSDTKVISFSVLQK